MNEVPKFSTIDLQFVKDYLYVDFEDDDLLIQTFIFAIQEEILSQTGYTDIEQLDNSRLASVMLLSMVSDLYNTRSTTATDVKIKFSPLFSQLQKTLRGQNNGYRIATVEEMTEEETAE